MIPQSPSMYTPWDLTQFSQSPSAAPSYFPESHQWSEISYLSKVILVLQKATSLRAPHLGCKGAESPGWFDVLPKTLHEMWCLSGHIVVWSCQSPVAHSCGLPNHPSSFFRGMFKLNTKFDADSLLYSLSHFECDGHTELMLTQHHLPPPLTSTVKSHCYTCAFQSTFLGCQVTLMSCKPFSLY